MKKKRIVKIRNAILPNKLTTKPLVETFLVNRLKHYISLHSDSKELKRKVLKLLKRKDILDRVSQGNVYGWISLAKSYPSEYEDDNLSMFSIGRCILGIGLLYDEGREIINVYSSVKSNSPKDTEKFILDIWEFVQSKLWITLGSGRTEVISKIGKIYENGHNAEDYLAGLNELVQINGWTSLNDRSRKRAIECYSHLWFMSKDKNFPKLVLVFLDILKQIGLDKGSQELFSLLNPRFTNSIFQTPEDYLRYFSIFEILSENNIEWDSPTPVGLITAIIKKYRTSYSQGEIDQLNGIPELIRDLILSDLEHFFNLSNKIFEKCSRFQFDILCSALAEENPELVQMIGEKVFESEAA